MRRESISKTVEPLIAGPAAPIAGFASGYTPYFVAAATGCDQPRSGRNKATAIRNRSGHDYRWIRVQRPGASPG
ncbi:hypothetical protein SAMN03159453_04401 [Pseudomonas sp. NFIX28]|nr:hypothetical protein SAMN03159453_04401 [Pseudomonas sp. NFIX28]